MTVPRVPDAFNPNAQVSLDVLVVIIGCQFTQPKEGLGLPSL